MNIKKELDLYLNEYLEPKKRSFKGAALGAFSIAKERGYYDLEEESDISSYIKENKEDDTFQTKLFKLIDDRELKDSDVYNRVNIDRRLFSKIRSNKDYHPSKETVILFGLALELSEYEIEDLLKSASYSLPMNTKFDLIVRFCFKKKIYDISKVNELLYDYNCKLLNE